MIKNYLSFLKMNESNIKNKITRDDLNVGDDVMTIGTCDNVDLDYHVGKIIEMKKYGKLLIEFETSFNKLLHAGHKDIGKPKHCLYVDLVNISTNNRKEFEKIIKNIGKEKLNKKERLNADYKEGDVIVGVGEIKSHYSINVDGEIGIVHYRQNNGGLNQEDRNERNNVIYWVGFLDKFDKKNMRPDNNGYPSNGAGALVDKIHMRHITPEELVEHEKEISVLKKEMSMNNEVFNIGDVVVGVRNESDINFKDQIGVIRYVRNGYPDTKRNKSYCVQFITHFHDYLYDVDGLIGSPDGYMLNKQMLREATPEEIEKSGDKLKIVKDGIDEFNYDYKIGDWVITKNYYNNINFNGQIGRVIKIDGAMPYTRILIQFLTKFNNLLQKYGNDDNCYNLTRGLVSPAKDIDVEEIKRKLDNKEILPFIASTSLDILISRMEFKIKIPFMVQSYFDVTDKNDVVSFLPVNKFKILPTGENPFKSRLRQTMKVGRFLGMLNKDIPEKEMEKIVNSYKTSYDICISGLSDKLKLVSGEDIRFWYCEDNYVKGGGGLNSSCMKGKNKGPEMQMFVDNPDVIQMLILTDENNKLLGRALVWRLVKPSGDTYMDYVYTRHEKDRELFKMYASQQGWISGDNNRGKSLPTMVCALNTDKKYTKGKNALDHFDTLIQLNTTENYLTNDYKMKWVRTDLIDKKDDVVELSFPEGSKVQYKNPGTINNDKFGIFVGLKNNKCKIIFDDGVKFAAVKKNVHLVEKNEK